MFVWKWPKINEKEAGVGPFKKTTLSHSLQMTLKLIQWTDDHDRGMSESSHLSIIDAAQSSEFNCKVAQIKYAELISTLNHKLNV